MSIGAGVKLAHEITRSYGRCLKLSEISLRRSALYEIDFRSSINYWTSRKTQIFTSHSTWQGVVVSYGKEWQRRRRLLMQPFRTQGNRRFASIVWWHSFNFKRRDLELGFNLHRKQSTATFKMSCYLLPAFTSFIDYSYYPTLYACTYFQFFGNARL